MMKMTVANVVPDGSGQYLILLADQSRETLLPIRIGLFEAQAIYFKLAGQPFPRPITYDLLKFILDSLDASVSRIVVTELKDGTFFARIDIESAGGGDLEIDSRPSDAIALALRTASPIYVEDAVLDEAGVSATALEERAKSALKEPSPTSEGEDEQDAEEDSPLAVLRSAMERAVEQEDYEEAARIRDEIHRLEAARIQDEIHRLEDTEEQDQ